MRASLLSKEVRGGLFRLGIAGLCAAAWAVATPASTLPESGRWPRFRGPNGCGIGHGSFPTHFGPDSNMVWKVALPGGHSSPCLWGDRIFLTGFSDGKLETVGLDRASGRLIWRQTLQPGAIERGAQLSNPATATPATDGRAVYVYFGSYGLAAYDFQGRELWNKPLPIPVTQHGPGTSPVVCDGRVLLACDQDTDSYLLCVDARTGETLWKTDRHGFKRGFATPLPYPPANPVQVILPGSLRLMSYNLADGSERWSVPGLPNEMVSSAVAGDGLIFVAGWTAGSGVHSMPSFDSLLRHDSDGDGRLSRSDIPGGPAKQHFLYLDSNKDGQLTREEYQEMSGLFDQSQNTALAVRPDGHGDVTESHVLWRQTRGLPYCPSPLYYEGRLFLIKNGGLATSFDARTGAIHFQEERIGALGDYYASPVAADGKICVVSQRGVAVILRSSDQLEVLARNELHEPVVATPALAGQQIIVRTTEHLYVFGKSTTSAHE